MAVITSLRFGVCVRGVPSDRRWCRRCEPPLGSSGLSACPGSVPPAAGSDGSARPRAPYSAGTGSAPLRTLDYTHTHTIQ